MKCLEIFCKGVTARVKGCSFFFALRQSIQVELESAFTACPPPHHSSHTLSRRSPSSAALQLHSYRLDSIIIPSLPSRTLDASTTLPSAQAMSTSSSPSYPSTSSKVPMHKLSPSSQALEACCTNAQLPITFPTPSPDKSRRATRRPVAFVPKTIDQAEDALRRVQQPAVGRTETRDRDAMTAAASSARSFAVVVGKKPKSVCVRRYEDVCVASVFPFVLQAEAERYLESSNFSPVPVDKGVCLRLDFGSTSAAFEPVIPASYEDIETFLGAKPGSHFVPLLDMAVGKARSAPRRDVRLVAEMLAD